MSAHMHHLELGAWDRQTGGRIAALLNVPVSYGGA